MNHPPRKPQGLWAAFFHHPPGHTKQRKGPTGLVFNLKLETLNLKLSKQQSRRDGAGPMENELSAGGSIGA
jgi:hypothetical protein